MPHPEPPQAETDEAVRGARRRLAPEQRKAQVLEAAADLFRTYGTGFTSAQVAASAGVSEGTVFRYFPDMASLTRAARRRAIGLNTLLPELARAGELPELRERLLVAAEAVAERIVETARLLESSGEPTNRPEKQEMREVLDALSPLFVPSGPSGVSQRQQAALFLGLLVSGTMFSAGDSGSNLASRKCTVPIEIPHIVDLFLGGVASVNRSPGPKDSWDSEG